jgi:hypothetical protein
MGSEFLQAPLGALTLRSAPPRYPKPSLALTRCSYVVYAATNGRGLVAGTDLAGGPFLSGWGDAPFHTGAQAIRTMPYHSSWKLD